MVILVFSSWNWYSRGNVVPIMGHKLVKIPIRKMNKTIDLTKDFCYNKSIVTEVLPFYPNEGEMCIEFASITVCI